MPYDDSDVKKMIKYQTERKVGFSKSKRISDEVKELIHAILEAQVVCLLLSACNFFNHYFLYIGLVIPSGSMLYVMF